MSGIKRMFYEFKSIFTSENILKENERHANIVTATTMLNLFLVIIIGWILNKLHISNSETINMTFTMTNSFFRFVLTSKYMFFIIF